MYELIHILKICVHTRLPVQFMHRKCMIWLLIHYIHIYTHTHDFCTHELTRANTASHAHMLQIPFIQTPTHTRTYHALSLSLSLSLSQIQTCCINLPVHTASNVCFTCTYTHKHTDIPQTHTPAHLRTHCIADVYAACFSLIRVRITCKWRQY
jgi:hypothetical protein